MIGMQKTMRGRYLLRLDDFCSTADAQRWNPLLELLAELGIRPILAVVPRNEDPDLMRAEADNNFWPRLRALTAQGAAIGLHGFRHLSCSRGRGLVPLHRETEFAGAPLEAQRAWIAAAMEIFRAQGIVPRLWVAPRHGFDRNTLRVLAGQGIDLLSDGFASAPYVRGGLTWLPQQLWASVEKPHGLWTICIHPNTATVDELAALTDFLRAHRGEFLSLDEALASFPPVPYSFSYWCREKLVLSRIQLSRARRSLRQRLHVT